MRKIFLRNRTSFGLTARDSPYLVAAIRLIHWHSRAEICRGVNAFSQYALGGHRQPIFLSHCLKMGQQHWRWNKTPSHGVGILADTMRCGLTLA